MRARCQRANNFKFNFSFMENIFRAQTGARCVRRLILMRSTDAAYVVCTEKQVLGMASCLSARREHWNTRAKERRNGRERTEKEEKKSNSSSFHLSVRLTPANGTHYYHNSYVSSHRAMSYRQRVHRTLNYFCKNVDGSQATRQPGTATVRNMCVQKWRKCVWRFSP